jgi:hypothetical protein
VREELTKLLNAEPFEPFQITLSSAQRYTIRYPGLVTLGDDIAFIAHARSDLHSVIRLVQIAAIDLVG